MILVWFWIANVGYAKNDVLSTFFRVSNCCWGGAQTQGKEEDFGRKQHGRDLLSRRNEFEAERLLSHGRYTSGFISFIEVRSFVRKMPRAARENVFTVYTIFPCKNNVFYNKKAARSATKKFLRYIPFFLIKITYFIIKKPRAARENFFKVYSKNRLKIGFGF